MDREPFLNSRKGPMKAITVGGRKFRSMAEAARHYGMKYDTFYMRAEQYGWAKSRLNTPVEKRNYNKDRGKRPFQREEQMAASNG